MAAVLLSQLYCHAPTCFIDHICWLDLIQVLHQVLAVHHCQHSIQLARILQIIIHKECLCRTAIIVTQQQSARVGVVACVACVRMA